ncbi:MAG: glycosyltransferase family 4 protein [Acidobacteriota bacterium]
MRLLFFAPSDSVHTRRWINYFAERGHQVYLADEQCADPPSLVATVQPDLVHGHSITTYGWRAAVSGFHPLVLTAWGNDLLIDTEDEECRRLTAAALAEAELVTADSLELLDQAGKLGARKRQLIRFGAELNIFTNTGNGDELRVHLGLEASARVVLSARAFDPLYNIDIIAAAIPEVIAQVASTYFLFKTYLCNTLMRRRYRETIERKMLDQGVREHAYFVDDLPPLGMQQLYRLAEVVVSIPSSDGFPVTLFEALACERPVIVSDLPAYDDIIIDGVTGLRVKPRDVESLAGAICRLLTVPTEGAQMARTGRQLAIEQGNFAREMARIEECYFSLIGKLKATE